MNKNILVMVAGLLSSTGVMAESQFQIGIGSHNEVVYLDDLIIGSGSGASIYEASISSSALEFSARYLFNNHIGVEGSYYLGGDADVEEERNGVSTSYTATNLEVTGGMEVNALLGLSLIDHGWFGYTGVGYYIDNWEYDSQSKKYKGTQIPIGFGYNFDSVSIDLQVAVRSASSYDDDADTWGDDRVSGVSVGRFRVLANF